MRGASCLERSWGWEVRTAGGLVMMVIEEGGTYFAARAVELVFVSAY